MIYDELTSKNILDAFDLAGIEATQGHAVAVMNFLDLFSQKGRGHPELSSSALFTSILCLFDEISFKGNLSEPDEGEILRRISPALYGMAEALNFGVQADDFRSGLEQIADGGEIPGLGDETKNLAKKVLDRLSKTSRKGTTNFSAAACYRFKEYLVGSIPTYEQRLVELNALILGIFDAIAKEMQIAKVLDPFLWIAENKPELLTEKAKGLIIQIRDKSTSKSSSDKIPAFRMANDILRVAEEAVKFPNTGRLHGINSALRLSTCSRA